MPHEDDVVDVGLERDVEGQRIRVDEAVAHIVELRYDACITQQLHLILLFIQSDIS